MYTIKMVHDGKIRYLANRKRVYGIDWVAQENLEKGMLFLYDHYAQVRLTKLLKATEEDLSNAEFSLVDWESIIRNNY